MRFENTSNYYIGDPLPHLNSYLRAWSNHHRKIKRVTGECSTVIVLFITSLNN